MTTEYSGGGDLKRSIELLWRIQDRPRRGPKPRLTVDQIAQVAIEIADNHGLAALSMRNVADQLDVTAMSLYTYVPGKAELVDVMLDMVYGEVAKPYDMAAGWRAAVEQVARQNWALHLRHPWLLQVSRGRPVLGPNEAAKYENELRTVDGIGLTEVEMDLLVSLVAGYAQGAARSAVEAEQAEQHTGMTDEEWWQLAGPLLGQVMDPARYPTAARVGTASSTEYGAAQDPARAFEFGLRRVLDGIDVFIRARGSAKS